jgi:hypothetical protein
MNKVQVRLPLNTKNMISNIIYKICSLDYLFNV